MESIRLGRVDEGVQILLERPTAGNDWMELWLPGIRQLRTHPQIAEILEVGGLIDYWDESGWPALCSREGETITCR